MKRIILLGLVTVPIALIAAYPKVSDVDMIRRGEDAAPVVVQYTLSGAPAVVTMSFSTNGTALATGAGLSVTGDVNVLVQPGKRTAVLPWSALPPGVQQKDISVQVRVWATNAPPDYMVINLTNKSDRVRYYLSAEEIPGGVTNALYKTSYLVMRKIPAANVEWRMGSNEHEGIIVKDLQAASGENRHYVRLTEDFYLGIYPVTFRQHANGCGQGLTYGMWGTNAFAGVRKDDMPYAPTQFVSLRTWMHDNDKKCDGTCLTSQGLPDIKRWPRDKHEIDAAGAKKCTYSTGTYTPYLRTWRNNYGLEFDIPTDAQWEFACRAGTDSPTYLSDGTANYSNVVANLDDIAWTIANSTNATVNMNVAQTVGLKLPNAFGLYDMIGNVWEWCLDNNNAPALLHEVTVDPIGPDPDNNRSRQSIIRGGSFCSPISACRSAMRGEASVPALNNAGLSNPAVSSSTTSQWQYGYRLWLPAHAVR